MSENTIRFLIGIAIPLGISAIWFGVVKSAVSHDVAAKLYTSSPMKFVTPVVLIGIVVVLVLINWSRRRWIAYGALATLIPVLPLTIAMLAGGRSA